jgi:hypothetical protein
MNPPNKYQVVMPQYNCVRAIVKVAPEVWITLFLAWICVFVSALLQFRIPASGAVLVGGALIAETMFDMLHWRKLQGGGPGGSFLLKPDSRTGKPIMHGDFIIVSARAGRVGALMSLAKDDEIKSPPDEYSRWFYLNTVERVEKIITWTIIATAIAGTVLWGYGDLLCSQKPLGQH